MNVVYPQYWIWMLGLPVSIGIIFLVYKRVSQITHIWFSEDQYERSRPFTKFFLRAAGFLLLFIGLLGPYWGDYEQKIGIVAREFYIVMDVSASMNARDIKPSRLERMKRELKQLIAKMEGDKIGLILFTENAYVQCPLTHDHEALTLFMDMAETNQFQQTGTQFRSALATAMDRFVNTESSDPNTSRGIILISDGEDFGDTYASLIERLKDARIEVFTVGVGTYEGAPIPREIDENVQGFKRYEDGTMVISRLVDDDLRSIANEFGTHYVVLDEPYDNIGDLERQIYALTASPIEAHMEKVENNRYQIFLFFSVILLFSSMFLMPIRKI